MKVATIIKCFACNTELKTYRKHTDGIQCPMCKKGPFIPIHEFIENDEELKGE